MIKWITNRIIDNYIKTKVKEIKELDIKKRVLDYINEHKEEIIERAKQAIEVLIKNIVTKVVEDIKNKV